MQEGSLVSVGKELNGANELQLVSTRRNIGYIFQAHNLLHFMTAQQNVLMSIELHDSVTLKIAKQKAVNILNAVRLGERIQYFPDKLSGGQK